MSQTLTDLFINGFQQFIADVPKNQSIFAL